MRRPSRRSPARQCWLMLETLEDRRAPAAGLLAALGDAPATTAVNIIPAITSSTQSGLISAHLQLSGPSVALALSVVPSQGISTSIASAPLVAVDLGATIGDSPGLAQIANVDLPDSARASLGTALTVGGGSAAAIGVSAAIGVGNGSVSGSVGLGVESTVGDLGATVGVSAGVGGGTGIGVAVGGSVGGTTPASMQIHFQGGTDSGGQAASGIDVHVGPSGVTGSVERVPGIVAIAGSGARTQLGTQSVADSGVTLAALPQSQTAQSGGVEESNVAAVLLLLQNLVSPGGSAGAMVNGAPAEQVAAAGPQATAVPMSAAATSSSSELEPAAGVPEEAGIVSEFQPIAAEPVDQFLVRYPDGNGLADAPAAWWLLGLTGAVSMAEGWRRMRRWQATEDDMPETALLGGKASLT